MTVNGDFVGQSATKSALNFVGRSSSFILQATVFAPILMIMMLAFSSLEFLCALNWTPVTDSGLMLASLNFALRPISSMIFFLIGYIK